MLYSLIGQLLLGSVHDFVKAIAEVLAVNDVSAKLKLPVTAAPKCVPVIVSGPTEFIRQGRKFGNRDLQGVEHGPLKNTLIQDIGQLGIVAACDAKR